jgi:hypothetical protein
MAVYNSSSPVTLKIPQFEDSTSHTGERIRASVSLEEITGLNEVRKIGKKTAPVDESCLLSKGPVCVISEDGKSANTHQ